MSTSFLTVHQTNKMKPSADAESWFTQYLFSCLLHCFPETKTFILPETLPTPVVPVCEQDSIKLIHEKSTHVVCEGEVTCKRGLPARVTAETSAPGASGKREWHLLLSRISMPGRERRRHFCQAYELTSLDCTAIFNNSLQS